MAYLGGLIMINQPYAAINRKSWLFFKGNLTQTLLTNIFKTTRLCNIQSKACIHIYKKVFLGGTRSKPRKNKVGFTEKSSGKKKTGFVIIQLTDFF